MCNCRVKGIEILGWPPCTERRASPDIFLTANRVGVTKMEFITPHALVDRLMVLNPAGIGFNHNCRNTLPVSSFERFANCVAAAEQQHRSNDPSENKSSTICCHWELLFIYGTSTNTRDTSSVAGPPLH